MKGRKVKSVKCHVGIHVFRSDLTVENLKHDVDMELWPMGVNCRRNGVDYLIPFSNITHVELLPEEK